MIKQLLAKTLMVFFLVLGATFCFAQSTYTIQVGPGGTNTYSPANVTCTVGDTIKFVWVSGFHPTQSVNGTTIPLVNMDGTPGNGSTYKIKMTTAGSVPYLCTVHGGMTGTITVNPNLNTPLVTENFSYTAGTLLTANGYTAHSGGGTNSIPVVTPGLTYPGSTTNGIGNAISILKTGEDVNKTFTTNITSGEVFASFLIRVDSAKVGDYFFNLGPNPISTEFRGRLFVKTNGAGGFQFGLAKASVPAYDPTAYTIGTTYQVVIKYKIVSGATNDSVKLFVNPALGSPEPTTANANAAVTEGDATGIGSYAFRQGSAITSVPGVTIDGLLIGQSWASVTPLAVIKPSVKFNPTTVSVNENAGTATVTLNVTNPNANPTSVDVVLKGGSAANNSDYTYTTQTVTFPASSTTAQTFTFPIIDDATQELDETIQLALRNATNSASIGSDSILTVTILANDVVNPVVNFVAPFTANVNEGADHIFNVAITTPNANATSVKVFVKSVSTADGSDYTGVSTNGITLTFAGNATANIADTASIINDLIAENAETIVLVLRDATNSATVGADSIITLTIPTNDQPLVAHFIGTAANVNENAGSANISIMTMGATSNAATSFDVVVKGGTATGSDYTYTTTTVTIPAGKDSTVVLQIPITNDLAVEADETVVFALRNINNSGTISTDSIYTLTIKSDDIKFRTISELRVNDTNGVSVLKDSLVYVKGIVYGVDMQGSATSLQYTLIDPTGGVGMFRSGATAPPAITIVPEEGDSVAIYGKLGEFNGLTQVNMDSIKLISKGNALKAPRVVTTLDESTESNLVIFKNAEIIDTLANTGSGTTLRISDGTNEMDLRIDADVTLFNQPIVGKFNVIGIGGQFDNSNPKNSGYQLLPRSLNDIIPVVVIVPVANIDSAVYNTKEGNGTKTVRVVLSSPANETTTVTFALTGGSAIFNSDFTFGNPGTLTFATGDTVASVTFTITDDATVENNETINFSISDPSKCTLGNVTSSSIVIKDNDLSGIYNSNVTEFKVLPNPASQNVTIVANETLQSVIIVNMIGQTVLTLNSLNTNKQLIDISNLSSGVYSVVVNTENGISTKRLIVK